MSKKWSDDELEAAVEAYLWMFEQEVNDRDYKKTEINKNLRKGRLKERNRSAVELRMQNISSVLEDLSLPWIQGYRPAKNVGTRVKAKIVEILKRTGLHLLEDYKPSADRDIFEQRVRNILKKGVTGTPNGNKIPEQTTAPTTSYKRDPLVKAWVLDKAKGMCEGCSAPAPFLNIGGEPFLEVHHVKKLADGGPDTIENAVALCPNCHRRCHVSADREDFTATLYERVNRLRQ